MTWKRRSPVLLFTLAILVSSTVARRVTSADWPQWRGPHRDAVSREIGLRQDWTSHPPRLVWQAEGLGEGYSSVVVSRGRVFTIGRRARDVICLCLDERTGARLWSRVIDQTDRAPSSTPTVDGDLVYALDPDGDLYCLDVGNGDVRWTRRYLDDFNGRLMSSRGFSESPLVDGDRLICTPGGTEHAVVALHKRTGDLIWRSAIPALGEAGRDGAGFASPVISGAGGVRQIVQLTGRGLIGVRASDGRFLWGYNSLANPTANIPTPIAHGDFVFAANGYNMGSVLLKLTRRANGAISAETIYQLSGSRFQNHHGGVVLVDGYVYGGHGSNNGLPTCLELTSGRVQWKRRGPGVGSAAVVYADRRLYARYQNGLIALINATPRGYDLRGTFQLPGAGGDSWSHPVVVNGRLLLREKDQLFAYDVRAEPNDLAGAPEPDAPHLTSNMDSLFRYASGEANGQLAVHRIGSLDLTARGALNSDVEDRLRQGTADFVVDAAGSRISNLGLKQLAGLPHLVGLSLELCQQITDVGIRNLQLASRLRVMRLTGTPISNDGVKHLTKLSQLVALDLEVCDHVTDDGCRWLGKMQQLKVLVLKKAGFEPRRITSAGIANLGNLTRLESLNLYGNLLDDDSMDVLARLSNLRELDLSLIAISDAGLARVATLSKLERLELLFSEGFAGPRVTDQGIEMLGRLRRLRSLNLIGAEITDAGLQHLSGLAQLKTLRLANTRLSAEAIARLQLELPLCAITR